MNMNDIELKNEIITILGWSELILDEPTYTSENFLQHWQVAGALIEKCEACCIDWDNLEPDHWRNMNHTANTPTAIIKKCVELLRGR